MNGGEIKNVLTLDVNKFDASVKKATAQLDKLDSRLEKVGQVAAQLDKGVSALSQAMGSVTGGFQILNSVVGDVGKRMSKASAGVDRVGQSSKKAAAELAKLAGSAEKMESMADWVNHYGKALDKLNPLIGKTTKSHQEMDKEFTAQAKNAKKSQVEVVQARTKALAAERAANSQAIKDRRKMLQELAKIEERAQVTAQFHTSEANRYFGKNKANPKREQSLALADAAGAEAKAAAEQRKNLQAIVKELTWKNTQLRTGVIESMQEVRVLRELAALDAERARHQRALAAAAKQYRQEKRQEAAENKALDGQVKRVLGAAMTPGNTAAASAGVFSSYFADQDAKWAKHYKDIEAGAAKTAKHVKQVMKEITVPAESYGKRQSFYEGLWGDNGTVAKAAKAKADEEIRQAQRAEKARIAAARAAARAERESIQEVAQLWQGVGALWATSKATQAIGGGVTAASEYQQADLRLKLFNLPAEQYEEFKAKVAELAKENPLMTLEQSLRLRMDAMSALGYNNTGVIDATLPSATKAANVLKFGGYDNSELSNITKNLYGMVEARQVQYDADETRKTFEFATKAAAVSQGKITVQDLETFLRNAGDLRATLNLDGLARIVPLLEQFKVAGGGSGGGSGVASVGTMVKMLSMYGSGKSMTNQAVQGLQGAGILNDEISAQTAAQFRETAKTNAEFQKMVKQQMKFAGFKDAKQLGQDPLGFIAGMRDPILKYIMSDANFGTYFSGREKVTRNDKGRLVRQDGVELSDKDQYETEMAGFKAFFARMGMSVKAVDGMLTALNSEQIKRADHVVEQINKATDLDQAYKEVQKTWAAAVAEMQAGAKNLAASFEPLLNAVAPIPRAIGSILSAAAEFTRENPMTASVGLMAAGLVGFNLVVVQTLKSMGLFSGAVAALRVAGASIKGGFTNSAAAATTLATATAGATTAIVNNTSQVNKTVAATTTATAAKTGFAAAILQGAAAQKAMAISSGILRGAMTLLGGPIGVLTLLVSAGAAAWSLWGENANKALNQAKKGGDRAREIIEQANIEQKFGTSESASMKDTLATAKSEFQKSRAVTQKRWQSVGGYKTNAAGQIIGKADPSERANQIAPLTSKEEDLWKEIDAMERAVKIMDDRDSKRKADAAAESERAAKAVNDQIKATNLLAGGGAGNKGSKSELLEKNAYQISLEQLRGDAQMALLDAEGIKNGKGADMDAKAQAAFIKAWMSGAFDDNKRKPQDRPMALGTFNKETGWTRDNINLNDPKAIEWMEAFKGKESAQGLEAGLGFAQGKAEAAAEGAAQALAKLTDKTNGQTASFNELMRGFARYEGQNPAIRKSAEYQDAKRDALTSKAVEEYATEADAIKLRLQEKRIEMSNMSDLDQQIAKARLVYQTEMDRLSATENMLRIQIKSYEDAGKTTDENYLRAKGILESMTPIYEEQREILKRSLTEASKTSVGKTFDEWQKLENSYNSLATGWLNNVADTLAGVAVGQDKIDLKNFGFMVAKDLSGMFIKSAIGGIGKGIMGDGTQSLFKMAGDLFSGKPLAGGGWLASTINGWTGNSESGTAGLTSGMGDALSTVATSGVKENVGFGGMISDLTTRLQSFGASIFTAEDGVVSGLGSIFSKVSGGMGEFVEGLFDGNSALGEFASTILDDAMSALSSLFSGSGGGAGGGGFGSLLSSAGSWVSSFFADGGSFGKGGLHAFAKGSAFTNGIYNSPTLFKFANGGGFSNGVMGEAGPEAVMPLSRDGSGRLGVAVQGGMASGGDTTVTIQINVTGEGSSTSSTGSEAAQWKAMANRVKGLVVQEIVNQKRPGGALA